ncbi:hypothetical protein CKO44_17740 [Rubrivivax gelatinosus]|uniref:DUF2946 family protein n=1 Tax=Rubrivivax gelatinosus TaxID=28068 RepID=UPI001903BC0A|nr:DUF2946 family protein [Rubrivivax gelatinosus]MBK1615306.1 hypothetical protein [Rubrivivax gelatinosus]
MLRCPAFLRPMARLALLAALAMALMPSIGRVLAAQAPPSWTEVCTAGGEHGGQGAPAAAHAGAECGYCVLGTPVPTPSWQAPLPHQPPAIRVALVDLPPRALPVRLCGLGAQGPPPLL